MSSAVIAARWTKRVLAGVVLVAALIWPADWAVWKVRGAPVEQVDVSAMSAAQLKGGKEALYYEGQSTVDCSDSLFRQTGAGACWQVRPCRDRAGSLASPLAPSHRSAPAIPELRHNRAPCRRGK